MFISNLLKKIDLNGALVTLYSNSNKTHRTVAGGFSTLIITLVLALLVYGFGRDFFNRTNPYQFVSEINSVNYTNTTMSNQDFILGFRYEDPDTLIADENLTSFYFNVYQENYYRTKEGPFGLISRSILLYEKCNEKHIKSSYYLDSLGLKNFFCLNYDPFDFGGFWDGNFVSLFYIDYVRCEEGSFNPYSKQSCASSQVTDQFLNNVFYISIMLQDLYYDSADYDNPLKISLKNYYHIIDANLKKDTYHKISKVVVESDFGWILQDSKLDEKLKIYSSLVDYNLRQTYELNDANRIIFGSSTFYFKREITKYNRVYEKIQVLVANIGGILKSYAVLAALLISGYNNLSLEHEIVIKHFSNVNMMKMINEVSPFSFCQNELISGNCVGYNESKLFVNRAEISLNPLNEAEGLKVIKEELTKALKIDNSLRVYINHMKKAEQLNVRTLSLCNFICFAFCKNKKYHQNFVHARQKVLKVLTPESILKLSENVELIMRVLLDKTKKLV